MIIHEVPAKSTRPRNRRDLIIAAASELFAERGYGNVSMSDVARAVNVQPSALYRHFAGKQDLLREAIAQGARLRREAVALGHPAGLDEVLDDMARSTLDTRGSSQLWTSEVRNLDDETQRVLRREFRALPDAFAEKLAGIRPELEPAHAALLAWAALDVLASISFHSERLPRREFQVVLREAMRRVVLLELPPCTGRAPDSPDNVGSGSRRETVMRAAAELFSRRGYSAVTLEDIGAEVGIAGASLYSYFSSKKELVSALVVRTMEWQAYTAMVAVRGLSEPRERIGALVDAYVRFAFEEPAYLSLLLTELPHLPEHQRTVIEQMLRDSVGMWVDLLRSLDPDRDPTVARIQVEAARMIALDVLQTPSLRGTPDLLRIVSAAALAALYV